MSAARAAGWRVLRALPYADGVALQKDRLAAVAADAGSGRAGDVLFVEHTPVITCGRSGDGSNLLVSEDALRADGVAYFPSGRGGDVTYHGPGQWTVYPVLRLDFCGRDLHRYLRLLEECVLHFLAGYGIQGGRREGRTGAWVGGEKIAAVGVAVSRWVAWHGFALNVAVPPETFTRYMHPCGIRADEGGVGSLDRLLGRGVTMEETLPRLRKSVAEVLELEWENG